MFTDDKLTEIFCLADDFCKFFDSQVKKYTLADQSGSENKHKYHREHSKRDSPLPEKEGGYPSKGCKRVITRRSVLPLPNRGGVAE